MVKFLSVMMAMMETNDRLCECSLYWFRFFIHISSLCSHTLYASLLWGLCSVRFVLSLQSKFRHFLFFCCCCYCCFTYAVGIAHMTIKLSVTYKNNFHADSDKLIFLVDFYGQNQNFRTLNNSITALGKFTSAVFPPLHSCGAAIPGSC